MNPVFVNYINRVLQHEGGYVNDPRDPGGETNWGISKRAFPKVNIRTLTRNGAIAIYHTHYWQRVRGDELPPDVAFQVLDAAVNHGVPRAITWLQRAVGVADDGIFGPLTLAAVISADKRDIALNFNAERLDFYTKLSTWPTYGRGWTRRIVQNLRFAAMDN